MRRRHLPAALAGLAYALAGCAEPPLRDPFTASGEIIAMGGGDAGATRACFICHGLRGEGDGQATPRLAGLPAGYLQKQLEDYADGLRPDPVMRLIAKALDQDDRRRVAAYYASLPPVMNRSKSPTPPDPVAVMLYHRGDPARGLLACASCHGDRGEGLGPANPPLAGQPADYIRDQMLQWRRSERRNDPRGVMLSISRALTPDEVEALAGYAAGLGAGISRPAGHRAAYP